MPLSQAVRQQVLILPFTGSNPVGVATLLIEEGAYATTRSSKEIRNEHSNIKISVATGVISIWCGCEDIGEPIHLLHQ